MHGCWWLGFVVVCVLFGVVAFVEVGMYCVWMCCGLDGKVVFICDVLYGWILSLCVGILLMIFDDCCGSGGGIYVHMLGEHF